MNFEKLTTSKVNTVADWIILIVVTNILVILFTLPIITFYPAINAGYSVFADKIDHGNVSVFKAFFKHFKKDFFRKSGFGLLLIVITYLSIVNSLYYSNNMSIGGSWFHILGYYVTLGLLAIMYTISLYGLVVYHQTNKIKLSIQIKTSLFLAGKYPITTVVLVFLNMIPLLMLTTIKTGVLFVFSGVSIPLLLHAVLTQKSRYYIANLGEEK
jgi:uncharacterized membrane protein YesL